LLWLIETRPEGQSVEYVQSPDDKKIIVMEDTPIITPTPRQPNGQPVKKPVVVPQNTQPEVTVFETKSDPNVGIVSTKPVITKSNTSNSTVTTITYPTTTTTSQPSSKPNSTTVYSPPVVTNTSSNSSNKIVKNHTVEPKQTFFSISRMYNMSVDELYNLNDMYSGSPLRIGQSLKVYQSNSTPVTGAVKAGEVVTAIYTYPAENQPPVNKNGTTTTIVREVVTTPSENLGTAIVTTTPVAIPSNNNSTTVYQPTPPPTTATLNNNSTTVYQPSPLPAPVNVSKPFTPAPTNAKPNYKIIHTIQAGETIYRVSKIYNVTVENLKQWNNLTVNTVEIGQELTIIGGITKPAVYPEPTPTKTNSNATVSQSNNSNNTQYHTLQAGETVFRVSKLYGVTVDEIVRWNNIKNFAVSVGQRLVVKK
jgi:membrane-bound lytic murein transglycosylase D